MSVELLRTLSLASYILAGLFFGIAVALFFILKVPRLIGDVTGATARKAIESIRQQNAITGNKAYKPSDVNLARGKVTDKMTPSGRLIKHTPSNGIAALTEKIENCDATPQTSQALPTRDANETTLLYANETTVLTEAVPQKPDSGFRVDVEMGFAGSAEIIE